jgi:hypothetical protein
MGILQASKREKVQSPERATREEVGSQQARFIRAGLRMRHTFLLAGPATGELIHTVQVLCQFVALRWSPRAGDCDAD